VIEPVIAVRRVKMGTTAIDHARIESGVVTTLRLAATIVTVSAWSMSFVVKLVVPIVIPAAIVIR
jgi:hypothetical protein